MACSTRPAVRSYLNFIEEYTGQKITQDEWHKIRDLANPDGSSKAKAGTTSNNETSIKEIMCIKRIIHQTPHSNHIGLHTPIHKDNLYEGPVQIEAYTTQHHRPSSQFHN